MADLKERVRICKEDAEFREKELSNQLREKNVELKDLRIQLQHKQSEYMSMSEHSRREFSLQLSAMEEEARRKIERV